MNNPNLFIVTGGPGAGKTTVLVELEKRGFSHAPEVAREIIQEQVRDGGSALPWQNRELYTQLMHQRQVESYRAHTPTPNPTFSDRGIPDTLSYARMIGLADEEFIRQSCDEYRYAPLVFLAPPWREIYETDTERKQDFAEAERTCEMLAMVYRECGYQLVELPRATPNERADFILDRLRRID